MIWLLPRPLPPPLPSVWSISDTQEQREEGQLADGRWGGRGWGRSQIIQPQESIVLYKSFNTLCTGYAACTFPEPESKKNVSAYINRFQPNSILWAMEKWTEEESNVNILNNIWTWSQLQRRGMRCGVSYISPPSQLSCFPITTFMIIFFFYSIFNGQRFL